MVSGCEKNSKKNVIINGEPVNTESMKHKHCTREATAQDDIKASLNYDIYYTGEVLNIVESEEKVTSSKAANLDLYEESYNKIKSYYEGLAYYDVSVVRTNDSVTNRVLINYDKIDIGKLLDIEGEEDNVVENGVAKVDKWIELAKKFGTKCTEVTSEV